VTAGVADARVEMDGGSSGGVMWSGGNSVANVGEEAGAWSGGSSGSSGGVMWRGGGSVANVGEEAGAWSAGGLEDGCGGDVGGERHPSSWGICRFLAKTAARLLDRVASLSVFACFRGGGASCGDGGGGGGASCRSSVSSGFSAGCGVGCGSSSVDGVAGSAVAGSAATDSAVADSAVADSAVADAASVVDRVRRRDCERTRLLSAHTSLLLLSRARLLSLAWRPGFLGGAAVLGAGGEGILRIIVSFSRPLRVSYSTLAQQPLSTHSW
jgi:hypothetical protein